MKHWRRWYKAYPPDDRLPPPVSVETTVQAEHRIRGRKGTGAFQWILLAGDKNKVFLYGCSMHHAHIDGERIVGTRHPAVTALSTPATLVVCWPKAGLSLPITSP
jgi:hypothetical protein